jgi:hypothetical protein
VHLKKLENEGLVECWDDSEILPGQQWDQEIRAAMAAARIAVLLVSADFYASQYIVPVELPTLLADADRGALTVLIVIVGPSEFDSDSKLNRLQTVNPPNAPLSGMDDHGRESIWKRLADRVREIYGATSLARSTRAIDEMEPELRRVTEGLPSNAPLPPHSASVAAEEGSALVGRIDGHVVRRVTPEELGQILSPADLDHLRILEGSMDFCYGEWKKLYVQRDSNPQIDEQLRRVIQRMQRNLLRVLEFLQMSGLDLQDHYSRIRSAIMSF